MNQELKIHGSILVLLKKYVESNFDENTWVKLNKAADIAEPIYMHKNYNISVFNSLVKATADLQGLSENELKEKFGEFLVPDLLQLYKSHINPSWKTFQLLENTELVMHKAVRKQEIKANPPVLNVSRVHDGLLIIDYYSKRKMASLAVGIITGIAAYYNEKERVLITPTTNPNDERVQIRIEFK